MLCESPFCRSEAARQITVTTDGVPERRSYCYDCFSEQMRLAMQSGLPAKGDGIARTLPVHDDTERLLRESIAMASRRPHFGALA